MKYGIIKIQNKNLRKLVDKVENLVRGVRKITAEKVIAGRMLSNKRVIANIIKDGTSDFNDWSVSEIEENIVGKPQVNVSDCRIFFKDFKNYVFNVRVNMKSPEPRGSIVQIVLESPSMVPCDPQKSDSSIKLDYMVKTIVDQHTGYRRFDVNKLLKMTNVNETVKIKDVFLIWIHHHTTGKFEHDCAEYRLRKPGSFVDSEYHAAVTEMHVGNKSTVETKRRAIKMLDIILNLYFKEGSKQEALDILRDEYDISFNIEELEKDALDLCIIDVLDDGSFILEE